MNEKYWNEVCEDYQEQVLSVFDNDVHGVVKDKLVTLGKGSGTKRAADIGCGVGRFTPFLAELFAEVEACDFSKVGLAKAKRRCRNFKNVNFHQVDLSVDPMPFEPVDLAFCVNVLIMPSLDKRLRAWRSVTNQVVEGGTLLLVVPAFESVQLQFYAAVRAHLGDGVGCGEAVRSSIEDKALAADLRLGVHQLDGVRTKHYLKEEVERMLGDFHFDVQSIEKLLYPESEDYGFVPWDWVVAATRR